MKNTTILIYAILWLVSGMIIYHYEYRSLKGFAEWYRKSNALEFAVMGGWVVSSVLLLLLGLILGGL